MNQGILSPLPSAAPRENPGGFKPLPQFRSALPVSDGSLPQRWFAPLVVMPSVPSVASASSGQFPKELTSPIASIPAEPHVDESYHSDEILPEIVLPPEPDTPVEKSEETLAGKSFHRRRL